MTRERWHRRAHRHMRHSLKARLVALFLLLAFALAAAFLFGMQQALGVAWRGAAQPLVGDYADRLVAEIGSPPSIERARALAQRLPVTVRISGPTVQWRSNANDAEPRWARGDGHAGPVLVRTTPDGHRIELGVDPGSWRERPQRVGWSTLCVLLLLTALAYAYVRRMLRPLDDIRAGAQRFGAGRFGDAIPVRRHDELGQLAGDVNAMAASIHQMLEAKRGLLLAISHELRSPLTRARLNTELLPEDGDPGARRAALLRDLQEMASLVSDLLESERLVPGHAALHKETTQIEDLVREVAAGRDVEVQCAGDLPEVAIDRIRIRLLLRNLMDNAVRHGGSERTPLVKVEAAPDGRGVLLTVRDFGPGVDEPALPQLAQPFWRPDASRERATGGVGLGLYLCKLVALAHGGSLAIRNTQPGLEVAVRLP